MTTTEALAISDILRACAGRIEGTLISADFRRRIRAALQELDAGAKPAPSADTPDPLGR